jgi:hypothetical protein
MACRTEQSASLAGVNRPAVDVMDESFVVAEPSDLARRFRDPALWLQWWPRLRMVATEDRGDEGVRWAVEGELAGTAEIWLQPWGDGVRVHWMLRADLADERGGRIRRRRRRNPRRVTSSYVTDYKTRIHALKDTIEQDRAVGMPRAGIRRGRGNRRSDPATNDSAPQKAQTTSK